MSRVIKFRAWDGEHWYIFNLVTLANGSPTLQGLLTNDDTVVVESTGLTDKNGKEIYEGDVLQQPGSKYGQDRPCVVQGLQEGLVVFTESEYVDLKAGHEVLIYSAVADNQTAGYLTSCEVIGNIYENPELLPV